MNPDNTPEFKITAIFAGAIIAVALVLFGFGVLAFWMSAVPGV